MGYNRGALERKAFSGGRVQGRRREEERGTRKEEIGGRRDFHLCPTIPRSGGGEKNNQVH